MQKINERFQHFIFISAESFDAAKVLDLLFEIIRRCESIGLSVDCITSDMGGGNQAIWRLRGIMATKYGRPRTTCPHPCGNNRSLHFLADAPHLLKNLRGHLVRQQKILLDDDTVRKNKLPSNEVSCCISLTPSFIAVHHTACTMDFNYLKNVATFASAMKCDAYFSVMHV